MADDTMMVWNLLQWNPIIRGFTMIRIFRNQERLLDWCKRYGIRRDGPTAAAFAHPLLRDQYMMEEMEVL